MWWSRCAQRHKLEPPPMFWDTKLLDHSLVPLLDPAGSVMLMPMLMLTLKLMPSSLEDSPLLTTLLPLQATLLEPLALLPQLLLLLAQLPLAMLLLLLLLLTTSPLSASQSPGGSVGASPSRPLAPSKLLSASSSPSAPASPSVLPCPTVSPFPTASLSPSATTCATPGVSRSVSRCQCRQRWSPQWRSATRWLARFAPRWLRRLPARCARRSQSPSHQSLSSTMLLLHMLWWRPVPLLWQLRPTMVMDSLRLSRPSMVHPAMVPVPTMSTEMRTAP